MYAVSILFLHERRAEPIYYWYSEGVLTVLKYKRPSSSTPNQKSSESTFVREGVDNVFCNQLNGALAKHMRSVPIYKKSCSIPNYINCEYNCNTLLFGISESSTLYRNGLLHPLNIYANCGLFYFYITRVVGKLKQ